MSLQVDGCVCKPLNTAPKRQGILASAGVDILMCQNQGISCACRTASAPQGQWQGMHFAHFEQHASALSVISPGTPAFSVASLATRWTLLEAHRPALMLVLPDQGPQECCGLRLCAEWCGLRDEEEEPTSLWREGKGGRLTAPPPPTRAETRLDCWSSSSDLREAMSTEMFFFQASTG